MLPATRQRSHSRLCQRLRFVLAIIGATYNFVCMCVRMQVIERIRSLDDEVSLLVVDYETDQQYRSRGIAISRSMCDIQAARTPLSTSSASAATSDDADRCELLQDRLLCLPLFPPLRRRGGLSDTAIRPSVRPSVQPRL